MKKYLHDNKELFNKVAQRQEVWNKFMELERRAKVSILSLFHYSTHRKLAIQRIFKESFFILAFSGSIKAS